MQLAFLPEAVAEAIEARNWYEARAAGLGFEFARAVDAAIASIMRNPRTYPHIAFDCQRLRVRRFPYSLIYKVRGDEIVIVAVFHQHREPVSWHHRMHAPGA